MSKQSSSKKRHNRYVFVVDEDLGSSYAKALKEDERFDIHQLTDLYGSGVKDPDWIPKLQETGMIAITRDGKIRQSHEDVVINNNARIIVTVGKCSMAEQAQNFRNTWPTIERYLNKTSAPCMARLTMPRPQDVAKKLNPKGNLSPFLPRKKKP